MIRGTFKQAPPLRCRQSRSSFASSSRRSPWPTQSCRPPTLTVSASPGKPATTRRSDPFPWKTSKEQATFPNQDWNHGNCQSVNQAMREKGLNCDAPIDAGVPATFRSQSPHELLRSLRACLKPDACSLPKADVARSENDNPLRFVGPGLEACQPLLSDASELSIRPSQADGACACDRAAAIGVPPILRTSR